MKSKQLIFQIRRFFAIAILLDALLLLLRKDLKQALVKHFKSTMAAKTGEDLPGYARSRTVVQELDKPPSLPRISCVDAG